MQCKAMLRSNKIVIDVRNSVQYNYEGLTDKNGVKYAVLLINDMIQDYLMAQKKIKSASELNLASILL